MITLFKVTQDQPKEHTLNILYSCIPSLETSDTLVILQKNNSKLEKKLNKKIFNKKIIN